MSRGNRHFGAAELEGLKRYAFHCRWRAALAAGGLALGVLALFASLAFVPTPSSSSVLPSVLGCTVFFALGLLWGGQKQVRVVEEARLGEGTPSTLGRILWAFPLLVLFLVEIGGFLDAIRNDSWHRMEGVVMASIFFALLFGRFLALAWSLGRFSLQEGQRADRRRSATPGKRMRASGLRAHPARGVWRSHENELMPRRIRAVESGRDLAAFRSLMATFLVLGTTVGLFLPDLLHSLDDWPVHSYATVPRSTFWAWRKGKHVERQATTGTIRGPLADLRSSEAIANHESWGGSTWSKRVPTGALGWVFDLSQIVKGTPSEYAASRSDAAPSQRTLSQGWVELSKQLVPGQGCITTVSHGLRRLLEADRLGWVALPLAMGSLPVRSFVVDLTLEEPRGIAAWDLPEGIEAASLGGHRWRIRGAMERLPSDPVPIMLRWHLKRFLPAITQGTSGRAQSFRLHGESFLSEIAPSLCGADESSIWLFQKGRPDMELGRLRIARSGLRHEAELSVRREEEVFDLGLSAELAEAFAEGAIRPASEARERLPMRFLELERLQAGGAASRSYHGDGLVVAMLTPGFRHARHRANCRACFANQKTLAGAIEMYNLDFNRNLAEELPLLGETAEQGQERGKGEGRGAWFQRPDRFVAKVPGAAVVAWRLHRSMRPATCPVRTLDGILPILQKEGYLQTIPDDPGGGRASSHHYVMLGEEIACLRHGMIQPPANISSNTEIVRQFRTLGGDQPRVLRAIEAATANKMPQTSRHGPLAVLDGQVLWLLPILLPLWSLGRWRVRLRSWPGAALGLYGGMIVGSVLRPRPESPFINGVGYGALLFLGLGLLCWQSLRLLRSGKFLDALFDATAAEGEGSASRDAVLVGQAFREEGRFYARLARFATVSVLVAVLGGAYGQFMHGQGTPNPRVFWYSWPGLLCCTFLLLCSVASVAPSVGSLVLRAGLMRALDRRFSHLAQGLILAVPFIGLVGVWGSSAVSGHRDMSESAFAVAAFAGVFALRWALLARVYGRMPAEVSRLVDGDAVVLSKSRGPADDGQGLDMAPTCLRLGDAICPICAEAFRPGDGVVFCRDCATPHHEDCWGWNERCATFACRCDAHGPSGLVAPGEGDDASVEGDGVSVA